MRLFAAGVLLVATAFWVKEADWIRHRGQVAESVPSVPALLLGSLLGPEGYSLIASGSVSLAPGAVSMLIPSVSIQGPSELGLEEAGSRIAWGAWGIALLPYILLLGLTLTLSGVLVGAASAKWLKERKPFPIAAAVKLLHWGLLKERLFLGGLLFGLSLACLSLFQRERGWGAFAFAIAGFALSAPGGPLLTCGLTPWLIRLEGLGEDQAGGAFCALAVLCLCSMKRKDLFLAGSIALLSALFCKALHWPIWVPSLTAIFSLGYAYLRAEMGVPLLWAFPYGPDKAGPLFWLIRGPWVAWAANLAEARFLGVSGKTMALGACMGPLIAICCFLLAAGKDGLNNLCGGPAIPNMWLQLAKNPLGWLWVPSSAVGAATVLTFHFLGRRFIRFPFSPIGFAAGVTWGGRLWLPFLSAWIIQKTAAYLGGIRLLRQVQKVGLGAACGHFLFAGLFSLLSIAFLDLPAVNSIVFG